MGDSTEFVRTQTNLNPPLSNDIIIIITFIFKWSFADGGVCV